MRLFGLGELESPEVSAKREELAALVAERESAEAEIRFLKYGQPLPSAVAVQAPAPSAAQAAVSQVVAPPSARVVVHAPAPVATSFGPRGLGAGGKVAVAIALVAGVLVLRRAMA